MPARTPSATDGAVLPDGAWPVMLTPFREDRSIDWPQVDALTDWLIENGAAGIFTVALSGEMYDLTAAERLELATRVVARAAGRVPVLASSVASGPAEVQAQSAGEMAGTGVDGVVLISSLVAGLSETELQWRQTVEVIIDSNPDVDFGIYECPLPYKRLPSLENVAWMAESGRFTFYKDTCQSLQLIKDRLAVAEGSRLKIYNAQISSFADSLRLGISGFSGYAANLYPEWVAWLTAHFADEPSDAALAVQRLLTIAEHAVNLRYPSSAKYYLAHSSRLELQPVSRWKPEGIGAHEGQPLIDLASYIAEVTIPGAPRLSVTR